LVRTEAHSSRSHLG